MKKYWPWLVLVGIVVYFFYKRSGDATFKIPALKDRDPGKVYAL